MHILTHVIITVLVQDRVERLLVMLVPASPVIIVSVGQMLLLVELYI